MALLQRTKQIRGMNITVEQRHPETHHSLKRDLLPVRLFTSSINVLYLVPPDSGCTRSDFLANGKLLLRFDPFTFTVTTTSPTSVKALGLSWHARPIFT